ncbi:hypothetical protein, partial [Undibacterium sp. 10I3]|uniref:hypothetical protein n=1 Tax=Undibacterium sp. 10I3 TaxID=3048579 RepID=UPI002B228E86
MKFSVEVLCRNSLLHACAVRSHDGSGITTELLVVSFFSVQMLRRISKESVLKLPFPSRLVIASRESRLAMWQAE